MIPICWFEIYQVFWWCWCCLPFRPEEKEDDLDATDDGEPSEKPHSASNETQLGLRLDLLVSLDVVKGGRVKVDFHQLKGGWLYLLTWNIVTSIWLHKWWLQTDQMPFGLMQNWIWNVEHGSFWSPCTLQWASGTSTCPPPVHLHLKSAALSSSGHSSFSCTISWTTPPPSCCWILPQDIDQVLLLRVLPSHCPDDTHLHRPPHKLCCRRKSEKSSSRYNLVLSGCIYSYPVEIYFIQVQKEKKKLFFCIFVFCPDITLIKCLKELKSLKSLSVYKF